MPTVSHGAAFRALHLNLRLAGTRVEPAPVVKAPAVGEHDATDAHRRGKRHGEPVLVGRLPVERHDKALRIVVDDRAVDVARPRAALFAVAQERIVLYARRTRCAEPYAIVAPGGAGIGEGRERCRGGLPSPRRTILASKVKSRSGLRVTSGCESTSVTVRSERQGRVALLVAGQYERSPGYGGPTRVAVLAEHEPCADREFQRDLIAIIPLSGRQSYPTALRSDPFAARLGEQAGLPTPASAL